MANNFYTRAEQLQEQEWSDRDEKKNAQTETKPGTLSMTLDPDEVELILARRRAERENCDQMTGCPGFNLYEADQKAEAMDGDRRERLH